MLDDLSILASRTSPFQPARQRIERITKCARVNPAQSARLNPGKEPRNNPTASPRQTARSGAQRRARIEVELAGNEDVAVGLKPRSGQPGPPGAFNLSPSSRRGIPNQP